MNINNKNISLKVYSSYNEINKNNKEVVEISLEEFDSLPLEQKKKYKILMTRNKTKVITPPGTTDHDLLLMLISEFREFKTRQEQFNARQEENWAKQLEFNKYIASRIDNLVRKNNLKE